MLWGPEALQLEKMNVRRVSKIIILGSACINSSLADMNGATVASSAMSMAGMAIAGVDAMSSIDNCFKDKSTAGEASSASPTWKSCAKLALNVAAIAASVASLAASQAADEATESQGMGGLPYTAPTTPYGSGNTTNPFTTTTTPLPSGLSENTLTFCQQNASSKECITNLQTDLNNRLNDYKGALAAGILSPPPGSTVQETIAAIDAGMKGASIRGHDLGDLAMSDASDAGAATSEGSVESEETAATAGEGGAVENSFSLAGLNAPTPTPGKLGMTTGGIGTYGYGGGGAGKAPGLTLWQKATKLFMGPKARQGISLAQVEMERKKSLTLANRSTIPSAANKTLGRSPANLSPK